MVALGYAGAAGTTRPEGRGGEGAGEARVPGRVRAGQGISMIIWHDDLSDENISTISQLLQAAAVGLES